MSKQQLTHFVTLTYKMLLSIISRAAVSVEVTFSIVLMTPLFVPSATKLLTH